MFSPRALSTLAPAVLLLAAACGDTDRDSGSTRIKTRDAGTVTMPQDTGTTASGCNTNPNGCVQFQELDEQCRCLPKCVPGYQWNAGTNQCDPMSSGGMDAGTTGPRDTGTGGGGPDASTGPRDTGGTGGGGPDAGTPPPGCTSDAQCPGATGACVFVPMSGGVEACSGRMGCQCIVGCQPFVEVSRAGCMPGEACAFLGDMAPVEGACVPDASPNAGLQDAPCSVQFDAQGNRTGETGCNGPQNFYCWGASPDAPTGRCARFCDPGTPGSLCGSFGAYSCVDLSTDGSIGLCLNQLNYTDIGQSCMDPSMCQGNECVPQLGCSARCDGLDWCPQGSLCLNAGANICFRECTNDSFCAGLNPATICETFGTAPNTFSICFPRCTSNMDCQTGQTCNTSTGRCQ